LTSNGLHGVISQKSGLFLALLFKHTGKYTTSLPPTKYVHHQVKNILLEKSCIFPYYTKVSATSEESIKEYVKISQHCNSRD
jgi:hypothetical protein